MFVACKVTHKQGEEFSILLLTLHFLCLRLGLEMHIEKDASAQGKVRHDLRSP